MQSDVKEGWFSYILPSGEWDRVYWQLTPTHLRFFYEDSHVKDNKAIVTIERKQGFFEVQLCPDHQFGRDGVFVLSWGGHSDRTSNGNDRHGYFTLSATPEEMDDFLDELCTVDDFGKRLITKDVSKLEDKRTDKSVLVEPNALKTAHISHPALGQKKHMDWDSLAMKEAADGLGLLVFSGICYYGNDDNTKNPFQYKMAMFRDWAIELYPDKEHTLEREMTHLIHVVGCNIFNLGSYTFQGNNKFQLNTQYPTPLSPLPSEIMKRLPTYTDAGTIFTIFHLQPTQGKRINHYFVITTSHPSQLIRWQRAFSDCVRFIPTPPQSPRVAPEPERITQMELNRSSEIMHTIKSQQQKEALKDRLVEEIDYIIATENYMHAKQRIDIYRADNNLAPISLASPHSNKSSNQSFNVSNSLNTPTTFTQGGAGTFNGRQYDYGDDAPPPPPPPPLDFPDMSYDDIPPPPPPPSDSETSQEAEPDSQSSTAPVMMPTGQSNRPTPLTLEREISSSSLSLRESNFSQSAQPQTPAHDFIYASETQNTKGGNVLKSAVSKKKRRFKMGSFDLDLTYITDRIIAMGFPSVGAEAVYRNDIRDVTRFFENRHPNHYKIYNLCSERLYPKSSFPRVLHFPFDDHNPPCFQDLIFIVRDLTRWLRAHPENIAGIHCKAGKGRTGLIICILMLYIGMFIDVRNSLRYYASVRTQNAKGVTIPSQLRYVYMFQTYMVMAQKKVQQDQSRITNTRFSLNPMTNLPDPSGPSPLPSDAGATTELAQHYEQLSQAEIQLADARQQVEQIRQQQKLVHEELPMRLPSARYLQIKSITVRGDHVPAFDYFTVFCRGKNYTSKDLRPKVINTKTAPSASQKVEQADPEGDPNDFFMKSKNLYKHATYPGDGHADFLPVMHGPVTSFNFSDGQLPVFADFYVEFHKTSILGKKRIFSFWLHTQFVEMGGMKVIMNKDFLDKANKAGGKDFQCEIVLTPLPDQFIPKSKNAI